MRKNKDELIKLIEDFVDENNEDVIHEFGNWGSAFGEVDVIIGRGQHYTDKYILNALREFYHDCGGKISDYSYKKEGRKPSLSVIYGRFGTWNNALEKAGLPTREASKKIPEEELTLALKEACKDVGKPLTTTKYIEWSKSRRRVPALTIRRRFGSWKQALKMADLE